MSNPRNQASFLVMGKTYAPFKVWRGSAESEVKPVPFSRREAVKIWHDARRFYTQTRGHRESRYRKGKISTREGIITAKGLLILQVMLFDFSQRSTGTTNRLDPCYATIARRSGASIATVGRTLKQFREAGIMNWVRRRRTEKMEGGGYIVRQRSNLYAPLPSSSWKGFRRPPDPPKPDPASWGATPPMAARDAGGGDALKTFLEYGTPLDQALARLKPPRSS